MFNDLKLSTVHNSARSSEQLKILNFLAYSAPLWSIIFDRIPSSEQHETTNKDHREKRLPESEQSRLLKTK